jgi:hypothetical protein
VNLKVADVWCDVAAFVGPAGTCALGVADLLARAELGDRELGFLHARPELHDHVLLMAIDAFKDKLVQPKPHTREDLVRIAAPAEFSPDRLVARAREARLGTLLWVVADWLLAGGHDARWSLVRGLLETSRLRNGYAARYRRLSADQLEAHPTHSALLARTVSDAGWRRLAAPVLGLAGALSQRALHRLDPLPPRPAARG